jgi:hypothetical protein
MQTIVLWLAVFLSVWALVLAVVVPVAWPDEARRPLQLGGAGLVFRALRWACIAYACLYAVGVL